MLLLQNVEKLVGVVLDRSSIDMLQKNTSL